MVEFRKGVRMKLAIVSDTDGTIIASAVCQLFVEGDMSNPIEASIFGRPFPPTPGEVILEPPTSSIRTDVLDAPGFMQELDRAELHQGLKRIHESMRIRLVDDRAVLEDL